jgi:hypothetical protein
MEKYGQETKKPDKKDPYKVIHGTIPLRQRKIQGEIRLTRLQS